MRQSDLGRGAAAELLGTALLVMIVIGSGVMGERLSPENSAMALLANSVATGAGLIALVAVCQSISGAHFNPVVTLAFAGRGDVPWRKVPRYIAAQFAGAALGVLLVHSMFELPIVSWSQRSRTGAGQWLSEVVATGTLVTLLFACSRHRPTAVPGVVGAFIAAGYWFTPSTCFVNPALTLGRMASDTFAGIRPVDVPAFVAAQLIGGFLATASNRVFRSRSHAAGAEKARAA